MPNFLLALVIVFGGWWLLRKVGQSKPAEVRLMMRKLMGWAILLVGGLLLFRGNPAVGISLAALGGGLIGESALFPKGFQFPGAMPPSGASRSAPTGPMTAKEALAVLGLKPGASAEEVRAAHRRLLKGYHPDKGGTDYLAAKINQAKDILLQELGANT